MHFIPWKTLNFQHFILFFIWCAIFAYLSKGEGGRVYTKSHFGTFIKTQISQLNRSLIAMDLQNRISASLILLINNLAHLAGPN